MIISFCPGLCKTLNECKNPIMIRLRTQTADMTKQHFKNNIFFQMKTPNDSYLCKAAIQIHINP